MYNFTANELQSSWLYSSTTQNQNAIHRDTKQQLTKLKKSALVKN